MNKTAKALLLAAVSVLAAGCGDPYEGRWEGVDDSNVDLDIRSQGDGYTGDGHIYLCTDTDCFLCSFDFDGVERNGRVEVDGFFTGDCSEAGAFEGIECSAEDSRMYCDLGNGVEIEYERVDG